MDTFALKLFDQESWLAYLLLPAISVLSGLLLAWVFFAILKFHNSRRPSDVKQELLKRLKKPVYFLLPMLFLYPLVSYFRLGTLWQKLVEAGIIINVSWLFIVLLKVVEEVVKHKFRINGENIASERKVITQLRFLKSMGMVVVVLLALASILWNIPSARQLGSTILTSAGVAGIIIGVAAQKSIANLVTGFQLAFTQTIKIDDEVVIEGEFGNVEDITLTYVVVKTWDWRRLVLPLNYFNDKPFVNWTFNSRPLIASVHLHVDYTFPVNELRTKLLSLLNENPMWDKNRAAVEVTDTDNRDMTVRVSFSVRNAAHSWKLRCFVREELIAFIKEKYPMALPKLRSTDPENM
jgi:small-conductance mechanosensitive channel